MHCENDDMTYESKNIYCTDPNSLGKDERKILALRTHMNAEQRDVLRKAYHKLDGFLYCLILKSNDTTKPNKERRTKPLKH